MKDIRCENYLCMYMEDEKCLLDEIALDVCGVCQDCIYIEIPEDEIERIKKKMLNSD